LNSNKAIAPFITKLCYYHVARLPNNQLWLYLAVKVVSKEYGENIVPYFTLNTVWFSANLYNWFLMTLRLICFWNTWNFNLISSGSIHYNAYPENNVMYVYRCGFKVIYHFYNHEGYLLKRWCKKGHFSGHRRLYLQWLLISMIS
jgi:hypothetical protein